MSIIRCLKCARLSLVLLAGCSELPDPQTSYAPDADSTQTVADEVSPELHAKIQAALAKLSEKDQALAKAQKFCPVLKAPLGTMGKPDRIEINGQPVFLCCAACAEEARADPKKTLQLVAHFKKDMK